MLQINTLCKILQGYNREREYIATQGPLPDTVGDFWRLIWDYNIPSVVMLTNLMEKMKVKCSQYWPDSGSQQYANVNVTLINTIQQADFTIRHFQVKSVSFPLRIHWESTDTWNIREYFLEQTHNVMTMVNAYCALFLWILLASVRLIP